jgi:hypothetical protein
LEGAGVPAAVVVLMMKHKYMNVRVSWG